MSSVIEETLKGFEGQIRYGVAGTRPSLTGSTNILERVTDVNVPHSFSELDSSMRATGGFATTELGLQTVGVEFTMFNIKKSGGSRPADVEFVRNAILTRQKVALLVLDQASGEGIDADFVLSTADNDQALDALQSWSVTGKLTWAGRKPEWYKPSP